MAFLSESERSHLETLMDGKIENLGTVHDTDLVKESIHILANGIPERLYALLHSKGHNSHVHANPGRTLLMFQKIAKESER